MTNPQGLPPVQFKLNALGDGNVEMDISVHGRRVLAAVLGPNELSGLAAHLLRTAHASFFATEKQVDDIPLNAKLENPIPTNGLLIGRTDTQGQKVIIMRVGDALIGFIVGDEELRSLGRSFISSAWQVQSSLSLRALVRAVLIDFVVT